MTSFIVKTKKTYYDKHDHRPKTRWIPVGRAFVNQSDDGDIETVAIELDAFPMNGSLRAWPDTPRQSSEDSVEPDVEHASELS